MTTMQQRETGRQIAPGVRSRRIGQTTILTLKGANDRTYQNTLFQLIGEVGRHVALEMGDLGNVNSGFLGLLAAGARTLNGRGGQLFLLRPPPALRRLLTLSGVGGTILSTVEDESQLP